MAPRPSLHRLRRRPSPEEWGWDEHVTLAEAACLFFPDGLFSPGSLRTAYRRGELEGVEVCGRILTTPAAIRRMLVPRLPKPLPAAAPAAVSRTQAGLVPPERARQIAASYRRWRS